MGIGLRTFQRYKDEFEELSTAVIEAKKISCMAIENKLYQRAHGYEVEEKRSSATADGTVRVETHTRHIPAEVSAAKWILMNRDPRRWRERIEIDHGISDELAKKLGLENLSDEELMEIAYGDKK